MNTDAMIFLINQFYYKKDRRYMFCNVVNCTKNETKLHLYMHLSVVMFR